MRVKDLMTAPAMTCRLDARLNDVAHVMWECDCGSVPIVDHDGRLKGIVTDRDICMAAYTQGRPLQDIPVSTAMTEHVLVGHVDDSLETAGQLMREGQVRRVPVIDHDGRPCGMLSLNDVTRAAAEERRANIDREVVQTLAAVGEPRLDKSQGARTSSRLHA